MFPYSMTFPRPHHWNSHLLLLVDGDCIRESSLLTLVLCLVCINLCGWVTWTAHGIMWQSTIHVIIMLKSPCNQLIVYERCRMTYSWNDLHRRRWSLWGWGYSTVHIYTLLLCVLLCNQWSCQYIFTDVLWLSIYSHAGRGDGSKFLDMVQAGCTVGGRAE